MLLSSSCSLETLLSSGVYQLKHKTEVPLTGAGRDSSFSVKRDMQPPTHTLCKTTMLHPAGKNSPPTTNTRIFTAPLEPALQEKWTNQSVTFHGRLFRKASGQAGRVQKQIGIKGREEYEKDRMETYRESQSVQTHACLNRDYLIN